MNNNRPSQTRRWRPEKFLVEETKARKEKKSPRKTKVVNDETTSTSRKRSKATLASKRKKLSLGWHSHTRPLARSLAPRLFHFLVYSQSVSPGLCTLSCFSFFSPVRRITSPVDSSFCRRCVCVSLRMARAYSHKQKFLIKASALKTTIVALSFAATLITSIIIVYSR